METQFTLSIVNPKAGKTYEVLGISKERMVEIAETIMRPAWLEASLQTKDGVWSSVVVLNKCLPNLKSLDEVVLATSMLTSMGITGTPTSWIIEYLEKLNPQSKNKNNE